MHTDKFPVADSGGDAVETRSSAPAAGHLDPRRRVRWKIVTAGAVLLIAGVLLGWIDARQAAKAGARAILTVDLTRSDYAAPMETQTFVFTGEQPLQILVSAPLDNAWIFGSVAALDSQGREAAELGFELSYYHAEMDGRFWQKGQKQHVQFLKLPGPGEYRLRVTAQAGAGNSAVPNLRNAPPLRLELLPAQTGNRIRVWGFLALSIGGIVLILRGAMPTLAERPTAGGGLSTTRSDAGRERMVFLDGLRGIACLGVLFCHLLVPELSGFAKPLIAALPDGVVTVLHLGDLGVEVFFVLSGFVIAFSLRNHRVTPALGLRFVLRRAVRLDPPYYTALVIAMAVMALKLPDSFYGLMVWMQGGTALFANVFYLQDLLHYSSPLSVAWTLCLEIQFYVVYVVLVAVAQRLIRRSSTLDHEAWLRRQGLLLMIFTGPLMVWSLAKWYPDTVNVTFAGTWFRFCLGVLTFWATQVRVMRAPLVAAMICILFGSVMTGDARGGMAVATAAMILIGSLTGGLWRWLGGAVWQHLGRISYSLYLAHVAIALPVLNLLWSVVPRSGAFSFVFFALGVVVSLASAEFLYRWVETPALRLSQRIRYKR